ncbi:MAG: acetate--CoA ligase [Fimbriimonadaceae bacterium]
MSDTATLETLLQEARTFEPNPAFVRQANASDPRIYADASADPAAFWASWADRLDWVSPYHTVCTWKEGDGSFMNAKWFVGGALNAAYNCVDRHVNGALANKRAIVWEGEPGDVRTLTYHELRDEVARAANALRALGVTKGDRVTIYMPMVPELPVAMLACARLGAPHCVVFGGFSAESLQERTNDAAAKVIITADGGWRRGKIVPLKHTVDEALKMGCPTVEKVVVLRRSGEAVAMASARDVWWHDVVPKQSAECPCEPMDSEDLLYVLHTSGSTGKPKGITHTTGGYLAGCLATTNLIFDLKPDDLFFCTADCGWVTGHSYVVYGPLANGATVMMYEGAPDSPDKDRFWRIVEKHKVTILYTAPTAIRAFMKWGDEYPARCDLSSLRLLGSVGEPINPEAWIWYHVHIGRKNCPIVDTWWQTETGAIMITPLPGITATKPGSATHPFPGIFPAIVDESGANLTDAANQPSGHSHRKGAERTEVGGYLVVTRPWPSMTRGIFNDPERFDKTYWRRFPGVYFPGDGAKVDEEGYYWLLGRVDDVMLVAGHNISTMEVESALVDHEGVAEAAVIGKVHPIKGQSIAAFVILRAGFEYGGDLADELKGHVAKKIGAIARPDDLFLCADLPKTRSGKIMRRLLRDVAEGRALGDTTTLADPNVVQALKDKYEGTEG